MEDNAQKRLAAYYSALMKEKGKDVDENKLNYIIGGMKESETMALEERISSADPSYKRLMAYATMIMQHTKTSKEEIADDMETVLKSVGNYDFSKELSIDINGNTFIYEAGFPIENYMDELKKIGDYEQGEEYSLSLDDGKLVIY